MARSVRPTSGGSVTPVEQLHRAGVVVQDIKPQNVLLDAYGSPVLADFGIADVIGRTTKVMPTSVKGTFNYMSPEAFEPPLRYLDNPNVIFWHLRLFNCEPLTLFIFDTSYCCSNVQAVFSLFSHKCYTTN